MVTAYENCECCGGPPTYCGCTDTGPDTIDVTFSGVADNVGVDCSTCTTYNSGVYTCTRVGGPGSVLCTWSGTGECGHTIEVGISAGTVEVYVSAGFSLLAGFIGSVSDPFDCTSSASLGLFLGATDECDWTIATANIN